MIDWWPCSNRSVISSLLPSNSSISLRLSGLPPMERPTGPGRRDRAAMHAVTLLRGLEGRVAALAELIERILPPRQPASQRAFAGRRSSKPRRIGGSP